MPSEEEEIEALELDVPPPSKLQVEVVGLYCPMCGLLQQHLKLLFEQQPDKPVCPIHSRRLLPIEEFAG